MYKIIKKHKKQLLKLAICSCIFFSTSLKAQEILENKFTLSPIDYRLELYCNELTQKRDSIDFSKVMQLEFYEKEFIEKEHGYFKDKHIGLNPIKTEELFPKMFYKIENFIPNVYSKTDVVRYAGNGFVEVVLPIAHILQVGDSVLIYDKNKVGTRLKVEKIPSEKAFIIKDRLPKSDNYFVYGTLVADYKELHYQELILLNLRVSQMLNTKIEHLELEVEKRYQELIQLNKKTTQMLTAKIDILELENKKRYQELLMLNMKTSQMLNNKWESFELENKKLTKKIRELETQKK